LLTKKQYKFIDVKSTYCAIAILIRANSIFIAVKSVLVKLAVHIYYVYSCNINNVKTQDATRNSGQCDIQIN